MVCVMIDNDRDWYRMWHNRYISMLDDNLWCPVDNPPELPKSLQGHICDELQSYPQTVSELAGNLKESPEDICNELNKMDNVIITPDGWRLKDG